MKTIIKNITIGLLTAMTLCSCGSRQPLAVAVESLSVAPKNHTMLKDETVRLKAVITPENATDKEVVWKSSKPEIADVDQTGLVTAIAKGEANIIVTTADGLFKAACKITVQTPKYDVNIRYADNDELVGSLIYRCPGDILNLKATTTDSQAHTFTWNSQDKAVATADNGKITFLLVKSPRNGWQFAGQSLVSVTTETGNQAGFEVASAVKVTLNGAAFEIGSEVQLNFGEEYTIAFVFKTDDGDSSLTSAIAEAADTGLVSVEKKADGVFSLVAKRSDRTVDVNATICGETMRLFTIGKALPVGGTTESYTRIDYEF